MSDDSKDNKQDEPGILSRVSDSITEGLSGAYNKGKQAVSDGIDSVSDAADSVTGSVRDAFEMSAKGITDTIQGTRNFAADVVQKGVSITAVVAGVAGEVALFSAGIVPYLVFGGLPLELAGEVVKKSDRLSKTIRGEKSQFIGVNHIKKEGFLKSTNKAMAILYDPKHDDANNSGFVQIEEKELYNALHGLKEAEEKNRHAVYMTGLAAVQDLKKREGLQLSSPDLAAAAKQESPAPR
ncbi:MAG: hypothetical protein H6867_10955 [Rhodospirillales bacterium]|nr:hypothetical protein [Rhodospirillales bacterium]MCB9996647.1 hypothetical protein [Rhodospirillales bacterium]